MDNLRVFHHQHPQGRLITVNSLIKIYLDAIKDVYVLGTYFVFDKEIDAWIVIPYYLSSGQGLGTLLFSQSPMSIL